MWLIAGMSKLRFPAGFIFIEQPYSNLKQRFAGQSDECLDLMYKLFAFDPKKRASAAECLKHRLFDVSPLPCSPELMPTFTTLIKARRPGDGE